MSKNFDVICVGGAADSRMYCVSKDRAPKSMSFPVPGGELTYTLQQWQHPVTGKWYHVAWQTDAVPTDEEITVAIVMGNLQPAWDLNQ